MNRNDVDSMMEKYTYWETPRLSYDGTPKASTEWPYPDEHRAYHVAGELEDAIKKALIKQHSVSEGMEPQYNDVNIVKTLEYDGYEYEQNNKLTIEIKWGRLSHTIHDNCIDAEEELANWASSATRRTTMSDKNFESMYAYAVEYGWKPEEEEDETGWM